MRIQSLLHGAFVSCCCASGPPVCAVKCCSCVEKQQRTRQQCSRHITVTNGPALVSCLPTLSSLFHAHSSLYLKLHPGCSYYVICLSGNRACDDRACTLLVLRHNHHSWLRRRCAYHQPWQDVCDCVSGTALLTAAQ